MAELFYQKWSIQYMHIISTWLFWQQLTEWNNGLWKEQVRMNHLGGTEGYMEVAISLGEEDYFQTTQIHREPINDKNYNS